MNSRSKSKYRRVLFLHVGLLVFLVSFAHAEEPLTIGFIGGLTGPGKSYGEAAKNGFEMGLDKVGRDGIRVMYEDDQFTPAKTVSAFKKLTEIDKVDVVIVLASSPSKSIAPLAEKKGIPLIAWASDVEVAKGRNFVFRSWVSGDDEGAKLAAEVERRQYPSTAFLVSTSDYGRSVQSGFSSHAKMKPVLNEEYSGDEMDFKPFLLKLRQKNVHHLGVCLNPGQSGTLAKQAKDLNFALTLFGCETLEDKAELALSQGALLGAWFVTAAISESFHSAYLKRFGNDDVVSGAAIHYDLAILLKELALRHLPKSELRQALQQSAVKDGAAGSYQVRSKEKDQFFDIHLVLKEITGSGFLPLDSTS